MAESDKNQEHGRTTPEEPLTSPDVRAPTHGERARTLVAGETTGVLSTLSPEGFPHGSYVTFALHAGQPVFLISGLATHTQQLEKDTRASLLVNEARNDDPLANGRVTLLGRCERLEQPADARAAFLARHPGAAYYADFKDFGFWSLAVEKIRYIGGYGRMSWVEAESWSAGEPDPLAGAVDGIVEHMNEDHSDAVLTYARVLTRAHDAQSARMTSIDRYGFELSVDTARGPRPARIAFDSPIATAEEARKALIAVLQAARAKSA